MTANIISPKENFQSLTFKAPDKEKVSGLIEKYPEDGSSTFEAIYFQNGLDYKLKFDFSTPTMMASNRVLILADIAIQMGFHGCFDVMDEEFVSESKKGLSYFRNKGNQSFLVLLDNDKICFYLRLDTEVHPVIGNKLKLSESINDSRKSLYARQNQYESHANKRGVSEDWLKELTSTLTPYITNEDETISLWANNNLSILAELKSYIGQNVYVLFDRSCESLSIDYLDCEMSELPLENNYDFTLVIE